MLFDTVFQWMCTWSQGVLKPLSLFSFLILTAVNYCFMHASECMTQNVQLFFSPRFFQAHTVLKSLDVCTHCSSLDCLSCLMFAFPHCNSNRFFFYVALVCSSHVGFFRALITCGGSHIPDNAAFYATALLAQPELVLCLRVCVIHMQISMFPFFTSCVKESIVICWPFFSRKINNSFFE